MDAETRAAVLLARRGLTEAAIARLLPSLGISSADDDAAVASKVDTLATDLPGVFGDTGSRRASGRPALEVVDGKTAKEQAREAYDALRPRTAAESERAAKAHFEEWKSRQPGHWKSRQPRPGGAA